jgi:hypothetical protein
VNLDRLVEQLDTKWRTDAEFDLYLARLLRVDKFDTLRVPTTRVALDGFGVTERDGGRVRKRPGFEVPSKTDWTEIENRRLADAQKREREHFEALERDREAQRDPVWAAQREAIRGVIDERLRELGLLTETPAVSAGEGR